MSQKIKCSKCGGISDASLSHCPYCQKPFVHPDAPLSQRQRAILKAQKAAKEKARKRQMLLWGISLTAAVILIVLTIVAIVVLTSDQNDPAVPTPDSEPNTEALATEAPVTEADPPPQISSSRVILIDPGHGGNDIGTQTDLIVPKTEKEINLEIALRLKDALQARGYTVYMTREADTPSAPYGDFLELGERVEILSKLRPDCFISLHCDSYGSPDIYGTRIYQHPNADQKTELLAHTVQTTLTEEMPEAKAPTIKEANFEVLRQNVCPSILIEMGFVSNPSDAANLTDAVWQSLFVESIAQGIYQYTEEIA